MTLVNMTADTFRSAVLGNKRTALVEFMATWCGYCQRIAPAYEALTADRQDDLLMGKLDIDQVPQLAEQFGVDVVPTFLLFRDGQPAARLVAPTTREAIEDFLKENL